VRILPAGRVPVHPRLLRCKEVSHRGGAAAPLRGSGFAGRRGGWRADGVPGCGDRPFAGRSGVCL
jgi:hypothetical protein